MKAVFERLEKISDEYRNTVDELSENYELDGRQDFRYSDAIQLQRVAERNGKFNRLVDQAAQTAVEAATVEINKLREAVRAYVADTRDTAKVQTIQALLSAGVQLSDEEISLFADGASYAAMKLLEKAGGHIRVPRLDSFKNDLMELESHFRDLSAYRGAMATASTARPWGRSPSVGNTIMKGKIEGFSQKVDEIAARWSCVFGGDTL